MSQPCPTPSTPDLGHLLTLHHTPRHKTKGWRPTSVCQCVNTEHFSLTLVHVMNCFSIPETGNPCANALLSICPSTLHSTHLFSKSNTNPPHTSWDDKWSSSVVALRRQCSTTVFINLRGYPSRKQKMKWAEEGYDCEMSVCLLSSALFHLFFSDWSFLLMTAELKHPQRCKCKLSTEIEEWGWFYGIVNPSVLFI